ncbi:MarR family winged helix-turn-helix transcriptional regulator [Kurthia senegalensis]|uniref:MarR family winged helix-turn-helix transcriptional regulator n=1 Tax=Kurthia senegalensis TaxID=1033740 RepID=UPI00028823AD|nr:MarR family transcriptional regulator [Kurthia senegalensis]
MDKISQAVDLFIQVMISSTDLVMKELGNQHFSNLSREQYDLLILLYLKGDSFPGDLATFQGVQKSAISNRVNKLTQSGYVTYMPSPLQDKRFKLVHLTEEGKQLIESTREAQTQVFKKLFPEFVEDNKVDTFIELLTMIQNRVQQKGR